MMSSFSNQSQMNLPLPSDVDYRLVHFNDTLKYHYTIYKPPTDTHTVKWMDRQGWLVGPHTPVALRTKLESMPQLMTLFSGGTFHGDRDTLELVIKEVAKDMSVAAPQFYNCVAHEGLGLETKKISAESAARTKTSSAASNGPMGSPGSRAVVDTSKPVETKVVSSGHRLVLDLDCTCLLTAQQILRLTQLCQETLKAYYTNWEAQPILIFTSVNGPRPKKGRMATSVHIIGHVRISYDQAVQLTEAYRLRLRADPSLPKDDIVVDADIYRCTARTVNIRAIYSRKIEDCPVCKGVDALRDACSFCDGRGRMSSKSVYTPYQMLGASSIPQLEEFKEYHSSFEDMFRHHGPWVLNSSTEERKDYAIPALDPDFKQLEVAEKTRKPVAKGKTATLPASNPAYSLVEEDIRRIEWKSDRPWKDILVQSVDVQENLTTAFVSVSGLGSSWCSYVGRSHGSNRIYFSIDRRTQCLHQLCYSEKGCKKMARHTFPLSEATVENVFGKQSVSILTSVIAPSGKGSLVQLSPAVPVAPARSYKHRRPMTLSDMSLSTSMQEVEMLESMLSQPAKSSAPKRTPVMHQRSTFKRGKPSEDEARDVN